VGSQVVRDPVVSGLVCQDSDIPSFVPQIEGWEVDEIRAHEHYVFVKNFEGDCALDLCFFEKKIF
jgi:hypothetical protein